MASLKAFLPWIHAATGVSVDSLYERQRALARSGLLQSNPGRGPGSGTPLTANNLATFLIALLAADSLADIGTWVGDLCNAAPELSGRQEKQAWIKQGKPNFRSEFAKILDIQPGWEWTEKFGYASIRVTRFWLGEIIRETPAGSHIVRFSVGEKARISSPMLLTSVTLDREPLLFIFGCYRDAITRDQE